MPKGHWKCIGNITQQKVVFFTRATFFTSNIFAVQYEDQGLGTHDWALDVDDSETHNLP